MSRYKFGDVVRFEAYIFELSETRTYDGRITKVYDYGYRVWVQFRCDAGSFFDIKESDVIGLVQEQA